MDDSKFFLPDPVTGYELKPEEFGYFSVVKNKEATNLIYNPFFDYAEDPLDGYAGSNATLTYDGYPFNGIYACKVTHTNPASVAYIYYEASINSAYMHSFSVYTKAPKGIKMVLSIRSTGGTTLVAKSFVASGDYQRNVIRYQPTATTTYRLCVERLAGQGAGYFETDAWQLEAGTEETTFLNGQMGGFVSGAREYRWLGTPSNSTSYRYPTTNSGGLDIPLHKLGLRLQSVQGLGISPIENISSQLSTGGSFFQKTQTINRNFTLNFYLFGNTVENFRSKKHDIDLIFNPVRSYADQPLLIRFHKPDSNVVVNIPAFYAGGLDGNIDNYYEEKISMTFTQFDPVIEKEQLTRATGTVDGDIADCGLMRKLPDGTWENVKKDITGMGKVMEGPDSKIYVIGVSLFPIGRYNPSDGTFDEFPDIVSGTVKDFCFNKDILYVVGSFTNVGGSATKDYIVSRNIYDPVADPWTFVCTPNNIVYSIYPGSDDRVYFCGDFTSIDGVAKVGVASYKGSTGAVSAVGGGLPAGTSAYAIVSRGNANEFGGTVPELFVTLTISPATEGRLIRYDPELMTWTLVGAMYPGTSNGLYIDKITNDLIIFGAFSHITTAATTAVGTVGLVANGVARYKSEQYYPFDKGISLAGGGAVNAVSNAAQNSSEIILAGSYTASVSFPTQSGLLLYHYGVWSSLGIMHTHCNGVCVTDSDVIYVTGENLSPSELINVSQPVSFMNDGTQESYPYIIVKSTVSGVQLYGIRNIIDNTSLMIAGYAMKAGEFVIFDMRRHNIWSGYRPINYWPSGQVPAVNNYKQNVGTCIASGISPLRVVPGENKFEIYKSSMSGLTMEILWNERFASLEDI